MARSPNRVEICPGSHKLNHCAEFLVLERLTNYRSSGFDLDHRRPNKPVNYIDCEKLNMTRWYYQKKELRLTPSIMVGIDATLESRYRREGARFIMELGTSMNLGLSTTLASAVVFFHRFYMCHNFNDFPRYPAACACLFLAGKVEETPKKCKDMIENARKLIPEEKFIRQFGADEKTRFEEVMTLERIILQTIKFDLQLEHPYKYLLKYATCLKGDKSRLEKMVQMAWNFVNDSLCTTLCLQWEPEIIAIALMHLACKLSKFDVMDWNGRQSEHLRWWDMFVQDMTIECLEDICHQVLDFYSQAQSADAAKTAGENPPGRNGQSSVSPPSRERTPATGPAPVHQPPPPSKPPPHLGPQPTYQQQAAAVVFAHVLQQHHKNMLSNSAGSTPNSIPYPPAGPPPANSGPYPPAGVPPPANTTAYPPTGVPPPPPNLVAYPGNPPPPPNPVGYPSNPAPPPPNTVGYSTTPPNSGTPQNYYPLHQPPPPLPPQPQQGINSNPSMPQPPQIGQSYPGQPPLPSHPRHPPLPMMVGQPQPPLPRPGVNQPPLPK